MNNHTSYLDRIMHPRDKNGYLVPIIRDDGHDLDGNPLYFPVLPLEAYVNPDGTVTPMLFEEDFAPGGKFFGRTTYAPGISPVPFGLTEDGYELPLQPSEIVFKDPWLNLLPLIRAIRSKGVTEAHADAAKLLAASLAESGICAPHVAEPDTANVLFLPNASGKMRRICNCQIHVKALRNNVDDAKTPFSVELELIRETSAAQVSTTVVQIPLSALNQLEEFLTPLAPWFALAADTPGAAQMLSEYIRDRVDSVPKVAVFTKSGWHEYNGTHLFLFDGANFGSNIEVACGKCLLYDPNLRPEEAFWAALNVLEVGNKGVTLPLMLITLLGPMFRLFDSAGYIPRFCGFLFGVSGSLKTSLAQVFYHFFDQQQHGSFRDTASALDVAVKSHFDQMLLVDDFQPAVIASEGKEMKKSLEHLIRVFGDNVAKKRSNTTATATHGERPRGSCLITGESISGSYSSLLRCLLIPISREDINGELLRRYQETPALWTTNYYHMLPWLGTNWDRLVKKIRSEFPDLRESFRTITNEPRLIDSGAVLMLVAEIFLDYGVSCAALTPPHVSTLLTEWRDTLSSLLDFSSSSAQDRDVTTLAKEAILHAINTGSLKIADNIADFSHGHDAFSHGPYLWMHPTVFNRILRNYRSIQQIESVNDQTVILRELYNHGLIVRDEERGKNSYLKKTSEIPSIGKRLRMLAFIQSELEKE